MNCYMIKGPQGGGGNAVFGAMGGEHDSGVVPVIVRRHAAIGDALCATVVADKLIEQGYAVEFQCHPHIHCVIRRHPRISRVTESNGFCHVNLDGAYENDPQRRMKHFHTMFVEKANEQLLSRGMQIGPPTNCRPRIYVSPQDREAAMVQFKQYPRPWVFICPRSDTYNVRQVPDYIWQAAASKIKGTCIWIGRHGPAPAGIINMQTGHFDNVITWLSCADLLVTVDTGPMHVAAALGVPVVAISQSSSPDLHLNDQNDFIAVSPPLDCLNCQQNICPKGAHLPPCQNIDPDLIASWVNARLSAKSSESVSAVVPIYQPELKTLNRCLECLLPQVDEVIVAAEGLSRVPDGAMRHERIRYVRKPVNRIGYGRNVNHGARYANGKYLLFLNDDVFLDPGAVDAMRREMVGEVAMVANLLRYPDGTIYHAGKRRSPGVRGWGHIDHRKHLCTITEPTEMENVCGACVMVRREAHFNIGGFDERFFIYAEDDDYSLRLRRSGYRIIFTPHSTGTHMEHQSTCKIGDIMEYVNKSNGLFGQLWGRYLDHNINRVPGNFDY